MAEILLYGHADSGHACKVALALALAGVPHRTVGVDIWADPGTRPAAFLAASPFAEVPLLILDGGAYVQSGAILLELATRFGVLGAESAQGLRRGREILMWEANRIGMCLPQLIEARRVGGAGFPPGAVDWLRMRYDTDKARFAALLGDAPFLHGDAPGIGDCAVWGYAQWLPKAGVTPNVALSGWLDRMRALPAMQSPGDFFPDG
ncbi:glutathione S-transferase [Gemmobacter megaterium]|uniref:Glutathione S-transferase n=1 Tax=Gemmobacter megaterium TaxID=1086013 RepID=A0A1N7KJF3_9RHOB|nr:glutathione S-transferase family protein [Gemmobacter megaterium]GGE02490.1 glutathione S-transferase [Gemmobacter megaterium]SIS61715.1 glutathione S-transferase [Gemmobacter megaterium]